MAARKALLAVTAVFVGCVVTAVSADRHARLPNIIERIMEPIVRQVHLSQIGGPMKQPLVDGSHLSIRKLKMEPSGQGDTGSEQSDGNAKHQLGNDIANSDNSKHQAAPGSGGNSHETSRHHPPSSSVVVIRGSGLPEPPLPASFRSAHQAPGPFDLMQYFLNSFMAAPPMMNADFVPPPLQLPILAGAAPAKTADDKDNSSDGKGVGVISVDFEVFVIPDVKGNATASGKSNATASASGSRAARNPFFPRKFHLPSLHLNRSAYRAVDKHAVNTFFGAERQAAVHKRTPRQDGAGNLQDSASSSWGGISKAGVVLLAVLIAACAISCGLGVAFTVVWRKRQRGSTTTAVWIAKNGKLRLRREGESDGVVMPITRIGDSWRA